MRYRSRDVFRYLESVRSRAHNLGGLNTTFAKKPPLHEFSAAALTHSSREVSPPLIEQ